VINDPLFLDLLREVLDYNKIKFYWPIPGLLNAAEFKKQEALFKEHYPLNSGTSYELWEYIKYLSNNSSFVPKRS